jgi:hypothetical protein
LARNNGFLGIKEDPGRVSSRYSIIATDCARTSPSMHNEGTRQAGFIFEYLGASYK